MAKFEYRKGHQLYYLKRLTQNKECVHLHLKFPAPQQTIRIDLERYSAWQTTIEQSARTVRTGEVFETSIHICKQKKQMGMVQSA